MTTLFRTLGIVLLAGWLGMAVGAQDEASRRQDAGDDAELGCHLLGLDPAWC
jgi:hypothetical protein